MHGTEWIVDAQGCGADSLRNLELLENLFQQIIAELDLRTIGETRWHQFPGTGGVTGLCLLSESHLACHTFPEFGALCLNLFCCVPRARWEFESQLLRMFSARSVRVREVNREYAAMDKIEPIGAAREER
jgi:S-adenosylmethionine decarboxylase